MAIEIKKVGDLFTAKASPPHSREIWQTNEPINIDLLVKKLVELGCHQTDIGDVLYEIDPALIGLKK